MGAPSLKDDIKAILDRPTCSVEELRRIVPGSKNSIYEAIRRGEIKVIRVGKRIHVVVAPLRAQLDLDR
jgi:hypothetical protein